MGWPLHAAAPGAGDSADRQGPGQEACRQGGRAGPTCCREDRLGASASPRRGARPGFPTWALTDWLRDFVEAEAEATQTPPDLAGMLVLAVLSVTSARIVVVRINDGYSEPLNLYIVVALPPANRKSPVFRDCTAPISEFEREQVKSLTPQIAEASTRLAINEVRLAKAQSDAAKADAQNQETLMQQAVELAREIAETRVPKPPRLLAQDATAEKVKSLLHEYVGRIAMMGAEGDLFDTMAGRYGNRGSANFGVYLDAHSGDDIRVDRVGRPTEYVRNPAPDPRTHRPARGDPRPLREAGIPRIGTSGPAPYRDRGESGRPPEVEPSSRPAQGPGHLRPECAFPSGVCPEQASCSEYDPHELRLSPEAERLRLDFADWLEPKLAPTGELGHIADWAGKLAGQVLRIAGNLHLADHAGHPAPWDLPVAGETLERAIAIGHYLIAHARAAFGLMGADPVISDARHILVLDPPHRDGFVHPARALRGHQRTVQGGPAPWNCPWICLIRHGYLRERPEDSRSGPGRRPSTTYDVNPLARSQNSQYSHNPAGRPRDGLSDQVSANSANCATGSACEDRPTRALALALGRPR